MDPKIKKNIHKTAIIGLALVLIGLLLLIAKVSAVVGGGLMGGGVALWLGIFVTTHVLPRCPHCHTPISLYAYGKGLHCIHCGKVIK